MVKHLHAFVRDVEPTHAGMVRGDRVAHPHRQDVRRQAAGIHPRPRTCSAYPCWSTRSIIDEPRRDTFHRRGTIPCSDSPTHWRTAATWRKARRAFPASCMARSPISTAIRSRGAMLDLWQTDGEGLYEAQTRRGAATCAASITPSRTALMRCARWRRSATRFRWTGRSVN